MENNVGLPPALSCFACNGLTSVNELVSVVEFDGRSHLWSVDVLLDILLCAMYFVSRVQGWPFFFLFPFPCVPAQHAEIVHRVLYHSVLRCMWLEFRSGSCVKYIVIGEIRAKMCALPFHHPPNKSRIGSCPVSSSTPSYLAAAVQQGSFRQAPATVEAIARFRPEPKEDPVDVARGMDILVPGTVANAIRRSAADGEEGNSRSAMLQVDKLLQFSDLL